MKSNNLIKDADKNLLINRLVDTYLEIFNKLMKSKKNLVVSQYGISTLLSKYNSESSDISSSVRDKINKFFNADLPSDVSESILKEIRDSKTCLVNTFRFRNIDNVDKGTLFNSDTGYLDIKYPIHDYSEDFINLVNEHVRTSTKGLIPNVLSSSLPSNIDEFWLSLVYFDKFWGMHCSRLSDYIPFNLSKGNKDYFTFETYVEKYSTPNFTCYKIPYKEDYSMLIFVSDKQDTPVYDCVKDIDIKVSLLAECYKSDYIRMTLPCFDIKTNIPLDGIITLSDNIEMKQSSRIICNEEGTKAASATSMCISNACCRYPSEIATIDEPFIFAIQDNTSKLPLFMGYIEEVN